MGIDMNLRDIRSPQYSAVTGRTRKVPYASILTALAPTIRADARAEDLDAMREQELLDTATRFDASQALTRDIANTQAEQAEKSMMIQGATLVPQAAYVADKAGLINLKEIAGTVKDKFFGGQSAIPLGKVAGPELVTVGVGEGATMTSAAGAGLMGASGETAGALAPELIGEAGVGGSAGVGGTGAGTSAAGVGTYALPAAAAYLGSQAGAYAGHKIGESLDVGGYRERGFVGRVGGATAAGFALGGPIGAGIGATVGLIDWGFNEGKEFFNDVVDDVGSGARSVYNSTLGKVTGSTWICTAIDEAVGLSDEDKARLSRLRRWSLKHHNGWARRYLKEGGVIVAGMAARHGEEIRPVCEVLKVSFVDPVTTLVGQGCFETAFELYYEITASLARAYAPDFEIAELPRKPGEDPLPEEKEV